MSPRSCFILILSIQLLLVHSSSSENNISLEDVPTLEQQTQASKFLDIPTLGQQTEVSKFLDCHNYWWKRFCQLPKCSCSGTTIPKSLPMNKVPQMIVLSFQGSFRAEDLVHFQQLLNRTNPNGCQATGTFYVEHENTDYFTIQSLAAERHEIGLNGITSAKRSKAWWKNATKADWYNDMNTGADILSRFSNITSDRIQGMRAPFLQMGGNAQFSTLKTLNMLYDASRLSKNSGLFWPYTYDYVSTQDCINGPCPTDRFEDIWQIPLHEFENSSGLPCSTLEECAPANSADAFKVLQTKFVEHYVDVNRAPLVLTISKKWINNEKQMNGTIEFLDYLAGLQDVYIISADRVLAWASDPKPIAELHSFQPWQCSDPAPSVCRLEQVKTCTYDAMRRPRNGTVTYTLRACLADCPKCYPWIHDEAGEQC